MLKTTKALAGLGAVAMIGVSMLPLGAYAANTTETAVSVSVGTAVSIAVDKTIVSASVPAGGDVNSGMAAVVSVTTNVGGYSLTIAGKGGNTNLTNTDGSGATIPTGTPAKGNSAWGYSLNGGTTVNNIPATATKIKSYTGSTAGDTTTINFPVSVKPDQAAGTYNGTVEFTVIAD